MGEKEINIKPKDFDKQLEVTREQIVASGMSAISITNIAALAAIEGGYIKGPVIVDGKEVAVIVPDSKDSNEIPLHLLRK